MPVSAAVKAKVLAQIKEADLIALSRDLIKIPSPTGEEKAVSDFAAGYLRQIGLEVQQPAGAPDRPNVMAKWKGVGGGASAQFSGHLDTVGPGDLKKWITDPFGGEVIDGKIYGRGSMDSKGGGIASCVMALKAIKDAGFRLKGDVTIVGTVDEEVGGKLGMRYLGQCGLLTSDRYIYCVHSDMEIKAYFKGVLWTKLIVRGQTAHGSMPYKGVSAISRAAKFITTIDGGATKVPPHPILGDHTWNFGWIHAGGPANRFNMVGDYCENSFDMRLIPGQTPEGLRAQLIELLEKQKKSDPAFDYTLETVLMDPPAQVAENDPNLIAVKEAAKEIMGHYPKVGGTIATGDLGAVFAKGQTGVGFGPGDLERGNAHKENEFLELDQLLATTKIYALIMLDQCGVA